MPDWMAYGLPAGLPAPRRTALVAYTVTVSPEQFVLVEHQGELNQEAVLAATAESFEMLAAHDLDRIMIDLTAVTNDLGSFQMFDAHAKLERFNARARPRGAFVVRADQMPAAQFIENVMVNRGMLVKAFVGRDAATEWLLREPRQRTAVYDHMP